MIIQARKSKRGMTIPEVLISVAIGSILVGVIFSMWYFAYRNWSREQMRSGMRIDLEKTLEIIKSEVRISSATCTSLYKPVGDTLYRAISFPMATPDANGFFTFDATGYIEWDRSVIYHVYEDSPDSGGEELRRTEFTDNNDILTNTTQRNLQLARVYLDGDGSNAPNSQNASTRTIIRGTADITFGIEPKEFGVDLYSSGLTAKRSDNINFGSIRLEPGSHNFTFSVIGQNDDSVGYAFGIDTICVSPSGCQREAETFTPVSSSGDTYSKVYASGWSGDNYAEYSSDVEDDFVTLSLYYDMWLECNFDNSVRDNTVITGNDLYAKLASPKEGSEICWQASNQVGSETVSTESFDGITIRNIVTSPSAGASISVKFKASVLNSLDIVDAYIMERSGDDDGTGAGNRLTFGGSSGVIIPAGGEVCSDWALFNVQAGRDYFITFTTNSPNPTVFRRQDTQGRTCSYGRIGTGYAGDATWSGSSAFSAIFAADEMAIQGSPGWLASTQTGGGAESSEVFGITIRNILDDNSIEQDGSMFRVKFVAASAELPIVSAYVMERVTDDGEDDGLGPSAQLTAAVSIGASTVYVDSVAGFSSSGTAYLYDPGDSQDTHMCPFSYTGVTSSPAPPSFTGVTGITRAFSINGRVMGNGSYTQLYFSDPAVPVGEGEPDTSGRKIGDDGGAASESVTIPAPDATGPNGYYVWSNWTEFLIDLTKDYLVTFSICDASASGLFVTYWEGAGGATQSYCGPGSANGENTVWDGSNGYSRIYAAEMAETWTGSGMITSAVYDTKLIGPVYNQITWDGTAGSGIILKARSSDNEDMAGALSWDSIAGLKSPGALAIGNGRYVQFRAEFAKTSDYDDYANYPWMDNVAIDWPGEARMCDISGYFTEKSNYGIIKLTIDGQELTKGLEFNLAVEEDFKGESQSTALTTEVEPRNTGK